MPLAPRNLLGDTTSPYLLQHAENPVHWRPWGPDALAEAVELDRPILLSIGYAACHWCHVMAHESFEDPMTADVMNRLFVNIKVDREERPDIDQIYMSALRTFDANGGWPLTMFLDPTGRPFWGGTYFPPTDRWGRPGFRRVLEEMARLYREDPDRVASNAGTITHRLSETTREPSVLLSIDLLDTIASRLLNLYDPVNGGTRGAPKFPQTPVLDLWWRASRRRAGTGARGAVLHTLEQMSRGGIWDHLAGGFSRYSVDEHWLVPHFEKMLYDNAQLLELLGRAWSSSGEPLFRERIEELVGWLAEEMTLTCGAFAASLDADSEGEEGRYYVWETSELKAVLGRDYTFFADAYDVRPGGNWEGRTVLNRRADHSRYDRSREARLADCRKRLLRARSARTRPTTDDKVLADWNGATIHALVSVGRLLDRRDWIDRAVSAYRFVAESMSREGRLGHSWRNDRLSLPGLASDLAHMARAAIILAETLEHDPWLADAVRWMTELEEHYADPAGGWYLTADDAEALILRPASIKDDAVPNHNAIAIENAVRLATLTGDLRWRERAEDVMERLSGAMLTDIWSTASLSNAFDTMIDTIEVVLVVPPNTDGNPLRRVVFESNDPRIVLLRVSSTEQLPPAHPAYGKTAIEDRPTAWACRRGSCGLPTTEPSPLRTLLETGRPV